jgi:hypothetical protein
MPATQQLFNSHIHHLCSWYSPNTPLEADMGPSAAEITYST